MLKIRSKSAQSMIEYLLFIAVVIGVYFAFLAKGGPYEKALKQVYNLEGNRVIRTGINIFF